MATQRSRKYRRAIVRLLQYSSICECPPTHSRSYLQGATGRIPSALSRPSSLLLDSTATKTAKPPTEIQTSIRRCLKSVPLMVNGKGTDFSSSTTQRSGTRSTTGSVSRPRSTSSSRRPFGEISPEAASTSSKAPLLGVLADRSLLRWLSVYDFYEDAKAQPRPRVVLYLQEGSQFFESTLNSILEGMIRLWTLSSSC
jgi:hypothetical protein